MNDFWLPCTVGPGQFPTESAVSGHQHGGKLFSLFAPRRMVKEDGKGGGWVRVSLVDERDGLALVRLPAQTFENGQHVTVARTSLSPLAAGAVA